MSSQSQAEETRPQRLFRYGYLVHLDCPDLDQVLRDQEQRVIAAFTDPVEPALLSVELNANFQIKSKLECVYFDSRRQPDEPPGQRLFTQANTPDFGERLLYAVEWWDRATFYLAPPEAVLALDPQRHPNAYSREASPGIIWQDISHYRIQLTEKLLKQYPARIGFYPLAFQVTYPTPQEEKRAIDKWGEQREAAFREALVEARQTYPAGWALTGVHSYRNHLYPAVVPLLYAGSKEEAEAQAQADGGLCFLVDLETGLFESRWYNR